MMFYRFIVFCLLIIGLHGNATELNMNDNFTDSSVNLFNTNMSITDNFTESSVNLFNTTVSIIDNFTESSVNLFNTTVSIVDNFTESSVNLFNTTVSIIDNFTESSVNLFNTTVRIIDNFRGVYVTTRGYGRAYTAPVATTTANVTILGNVNEPTENTTRFTCGKYNPCHWQFYNVYNQERTFEMEYPSVTEHNLTLPRPLVKLLAMYVIGISNSPA
ncbi:uncharacterized protein LOC129978216 isoform X2 [Argiope bruennichi]|uniref:uncharacterized protein LOC129978216 isoform X2 n=1 Tax=Argiope bruennichi TaxID=94029 RepID=UPI002495A0E5|nr:uncharacterized protein LOC129978216 isoform X2 [Argiope bruennichi]